MPASESNTYQNKAFGANRKGMIHLRAGGSLELREENSVVMNENGIIVASNDKDNTLTLIPWGNVAMVRTLDSAKKALRELPEGSDFPDIGQPRYPELT